MDETVILGVGGEEPDPISSTPGVLKYYNKCNEIFLIILWVTAMVERYLYIYIFLAVTAVSTPIEDDDVVIIGGTFGQGIWNFYITSYLN